ncbi:restriction system modified-DNA reader domain-containing protein [Micromonospora sp. NPDC003776]
MSVFELEDTVKQCVERAARFRRQQQRIGEQNTKAGLIEPVIGALGWDLFDPDEVHREYRRRGADNPVDYALLLLRTPRLFIEAKGLGENLDDPRWANQTVAYATAAGVEWVALTDGSEWRVYNAHAPVPIEHKLFRAVRLEDDTDAAVELLSLLSKDNMRDNRIEELWKGYFVDRQVHRELQDLFGSGEPAAELVAMLDRRLPRLSRDEIRSSLIRVRATFDFPSSAAPGTGVGPTTRFTGPGLPLAESVPAAVVPPPRTSPIAGARSRTPKRQVSGAERATKMIDLLRAGRLRPGSKLYAKYLGKQFVAELLADGSIRYGDRTLASPSAAGEAVKVDVYGPEITATRRATDGLDFWSAEDACVGDVVSLKEIRRRVAIGGGA